MTLTLERRLAVLKALCKSREKMIGSKIYCMKALYEYGKLHFSDLYRVLNDEYKVKVSTGWLHKHIRVMEELGIYVCERLSNRVLISLKDLEVVNWLLGDVKFADEEREDAVSHLLRYMTITKRKWGSIYIRGRNQDIPFPEYAKKIAVELSAVAIDPQKQISLINRVLGRLNLGLDIKSVEENKEGKGPIVKEGKCITVITEHELYSLLEEELKSIDPKAYEAFIKLKQDPSITEEIKNIAFKVPKRVFTLPNLQALLHLNKRGLYVN